MKIKLQTLLEDPISKFLELDIKKIFLNEKMNLKVFNRENKIKLVLVTEHKGWIYSTEIFRKFNDDYWKQKDDFYKNSLLLINLGKLLKQEYISDTLSTAEYFKFLSLKNHQDFISLFQFQEHQFGIRAIVLDKDKLSLNDLINFYYKIKEDPA